MALQVCKAPLLNPLQIQEIIVEVGRNLDLNQSLLVQISRVPFALLVGLFCFDQWSMCGRRCLIHLARKDKRKENSMRLR